jgi:hypothetical protein
MDAMKKQFDEPVIVSYERDELVQDTAFTILLNSGQ